MDLQPVALADRFVRLEPFTEAMKADIGTALDCDPDAWNGMVAPAYGAHFDGWWTSAMTAMQAGSRIPYAVQDAASGQIVGTTSLYEIKPDYRRCEIGSTFYRPEARGGPVNPACKRLLLAHAFQAGAVRVEIITDAVNAASRAAIRKLGARDEGVLRKHKITWTGRIRDTAQFAILDEDWPEVQARLDARLANFLNAVILGLLSRGPMAASGAISAMSGAGDAPSLSATSPSNRPSGQEPEGDGIF